MRHYYQEDFSNMHGTIYCKSWSKKIRSFYEGDEAVLQTASTEVVLKQILKTFSIYALRRKLFQGIPVIGMAIGSTVNYRLTRNVTEFANRFLSSAPYSRERKKSIKKARGRSLSLF